MSASSYPGVDSSWVFLVGLFLFVGLGSGGIKANVITLGGDQFDVIKPEEEVQQDSFFNYFYWVINLGALVSYGYLAQLSLLCRGWTDGQHNEKPEGGHVSGWDANSGKHIYVADVSGQVDDVWGLQLVEKDGSLDPFHTSISFDV